MRNKVKALAVMPLILAIRSLPLNAHHGNAAYDVSKTITVKGVVTEWFWANPHCLLKIDSKDENGEVHHWVMEANNVPSMSKVGWTKSSFKPGDEVTVTMTPPKNGSPVGRIIAGGNNTIVLNGKPFRPANADATGDSGAAQTP
jgi:Family of unknown function (DUF6152)